MRLAGDKGYSHRRVRRPLWPRGVEPVIPRRSDQIGRCGRPARFDADGYRRRNAFERRVEWLMGERRVGTGQDELASHFFGFLRLPTVKVPLRRLRNTT